MRSFLRSTAGNCVRGTCAEKIGGRGSTVEIDETLIARRKYSKLCLDVTPIWQQVFVTSIEVSPLFRG